MNSTDPLASAAPGAPGTPVPCSQRPPPPDAVLVRSALRQVIDPELGCNIVDLGLVYDIAIQDRRVRVTMTLTTPGCPMHESLCWGVENAVLSLEAVDEVAVDLVWDPPWDPSRMSQAGRAATGVRL